MFADTELEDFTEAIDKILDQKKYQYTYDINKDGSMIAYRHYQGSVVEKVDQEHKQIKMSPCGILDWDFPYRPSVSLMLEAGVSHKLAKIIFRRRLDELIDAKTRYVFLYTNLMTLEGNILKLVMPESDEIDTINETLTNKILSYLLDD
jgi:hypothetical protein